MKPTSDLQEVLESEIKYVPRMNKFVLLIHFVVFCSVPENGTSVSCIDSLELRVLTIFQIFISISAMPMTTRPPSNSVIQSFVFDTREHSLPSHYFE